MLQAQRLLLAIVAAVLLVACGGGNNATPTMTLAPTSNSQEAPQQSTFATVTPLPNVAVVTASSYQLLLPNDNLFAQSQNPTDVFITVRQDNPQGVYYNQRAMEALLKLHNPVVNVVLVIDAPKTNPSADTENGANLYRIPTTNRFNMTFGVAFAIVLSANPDWSENLSGQHATAIEFAYYCTPYAPYVQVVEERNGTPVTEDEYTEYLGALCGLGDIMAPAAPGATDGRIETTPGVGVPIP